MARIDETRPFLPVSIAVLTVSDTRTAANDTSGDTLAERIASAGHRVADRAIERDDASRIEARLRAWIANPGVDVVVTTGVTGITGRDVTPEATVTILDRELLGISEALRASGLSAGITDAGLSRGLAGISGSTLVVNIAGSRYAVRDGMATLNPLAAHVIGQLSSLEI